MKDFNHSNQINKSYYNNDISNFLCDNPDEILGSLLNYNSKCGLNCSQEQAEAWKQQIFFLQNKLKNSMYSGQIIFEYNIVRLGKRIDVVLLIKHIVFLLEFKNGATRYLARDAEQAEDYAIDIKNFHKESEKLYVCPILIATNAENRKNIIDNYDNMQIQLQYANDNTFMNCIKDVCNKYGTDEKIDFTKWYNSQYCPTPTIIEVAIAMYKYHTVAEIAHSEAGQEDIDACEKKIKEIIEYSKINHKKSICFITGVPGAGKTLIGLDLVANNLNVEKNIKSVYLSGNGSLVAVLRKALIENELDRKNKISKEKLSINKRKEINAGVNTFIQEAYKFRKDNISNLDNEDYEPPENVIIFDEAQRCWSKSKLTNWTKKKIGKDITVSEPNYFIQIMNKRKDWAVIICLVGLGQEIYDGEVGINEWFRSAIQDFDDWDIYYSSKLFYRSEDRNIDKSLIMSFPRVHMIDELHLSTSVRSFRNEKQSSFVDNILGNNTINAKKIYNKIKKEYPIAITRDIKKAKNYIRNKVHGSQRCGIVACSSAQRLKPEGIFVTTNIDVEKWFLSPKEDLRSSNVMEIVASEFKVQGLEIDYSVVCWDADLRREGNGWGYYNFKGTKWQKRKNQEQQRYLLNAYRVLLTRARQEMVIFVPEGVDEEIDPTRNKIYYNEIFKYLHESCGIEEL